jgi:hypothetical protein
MCFGEQVNLLTLYSKVYFHVLKPVTQYVNEMQSLL